MGNLTMNPYVNERMFMNESDANNLGYFTLLTGLVMLFILNNISHLVKEKINTHSMLGFVKYVKHHLLQSYRETCTISNCYTCMHNC